MSTEYICHTDERFELSINESSSQFNIISTAHQDFVNSRVSRTLTAEEVIDIAMKLIQPTLYNVADPKKFMDDVIRKKLSELFV